MGSDPWSVQTYDEWIAAHPEVLAAERRVTIKCPECGGSRTIDCPDVGNCKQCDGCDRIVECPECDGAGTIEKTENDSHEVYKRVIAEDARRLKRYEEVR